LSGARFSEMAVGDASFWHKLVRGRVPRVDTVDRIRAFMRDYGREGE